MEVATGDAAALRGYWKRHGSGTNRFERYRQAGNVMALVEAVGGADRGGTGFARPTLLLEVPVEQANLHA
jgi:hypothetical protein